MTGPADHPTSGATRALFDIPAEVTYLNCASMAPLSRAVTAAGLDAVRARSAPWTLGAAEWFSGGERLRALFARLVNADADGVALVPAASYGIAVAAANVEVARGQAIVLLEGEFPSNVHAWHALAERRGARVVTVSRPADATWTDALLDAIGDDAAVVSVPNCHWTDGALVELRPIAERVRAVGAALVVDASQSVGAHPLDVAEVRPDFLVTVGYKWLLGPFGLGYLYAAPRWRERGMPLEHSWLTRMGAEDFSRLGEDAAAFRPGARRFDAGEFPQFVLAPMAEAALEQLLGWGVARVQASLAALTARVAAGVEALGGTVPAARVGHMVGVRLPGGIPSGLPGALAAAQVYASVRGDAIRVAPHLYNDARDVDRLLAVLRAVSA